MSWFWRFLRLHVLLRRSNGLGWPTAILVFLGCFAPVSVAAQATWDTRFHARGVDHTVFAMVADQQGNLYVAGAFRSAGPLVASVAKWDGERWSALGEADSTIKALALDRQGNLYAGGYFSTIGGVAAAKIARWDGAAWSPVGTGAGGFVEALAVDSQDQLYMGGNFCIIDGDLLCNIAKWDGKAWSSLRGKGDGLGRVFAVAVDQQDQLYVGTESITVGRLARWRGDDWLALGAGVDATVFALAFDTNNQLYAGGSFRQAGGKATNGIARWDGATWSALGSGVDGSVFALTFAADGTLYVGGSFKQAGSAQAAGIATWQGTQWAPVSGGVSGSKSAETTVYALAVTTDGALYAGGSFTAAGNLAATKIARWQTGRWSAVGDGQGMNGPVKALVVDSNNHLFAAGEFTHAGAAAAQGVARWDGVCWHALVSGIPLDPLSDTIQQMVIDSKDQLYVAGSFIFAGGVRANGIAQWDGKAWSGLTAGITGLRTVHALALDAQDNLYSAETYMPNFTFQRRVAKWDGSQWTTISDNLAFPLDALHVTDDGTLYASGDFRPSGALTPDHRVVKWDGNQWVIVGQFNWSIHALLSTGPNTLYAGGRFDQVNGTTSKHMAQWNGTSWSALGAGIENGNVFYDHNVATLLLGKAGAFYAGGNFQKSGETQLNHLAAWDGSTWSAVGGGVGGQVHALARDTQETLFVGGAFLKAGATPSQFIAAYGVAALPAETPCQRVAVNGELYLPIVVRQ